MVILNYGIKHLFCKEKSVYLKCMTIYIEVQSNVRLHFMICFPRGNGGGAFSSSTITRQNYVHGLPVLQVGMG